MRVYLDNAASTPISKEVMDTMMQHMQDQYGNPSSIHLKGREARTAIEEARKTIANALQASLGEIFFTSGGSESNNMAIKCAVRDLGVQRVISSPVEHHCVLHTVQSLDIETSMLKVDALGRPDYDDLEAQLQASDKPTLVSLMHGNNEIGTMIHLEKVTELCDKHGAYFHTDSVQTMAHFPYDLSKTRVNFLSGSAHKFHGPKGCGFIYINSDNVIKPYIHGGSQERNMRAGTENTYGIVGLAKAMELAYKDLDTRRKHIQGLKNHLIAGLKASFPDISFNGDYDGHSLYHVLSVSFPPSAKNDLIVFSLDIAGVCVSGGSACSSGVESGSHVLSTLYPDDLRKTIRFSFSHYNTIEEIDYTLEKLKAIVI